MLVCVVALEGGQAPPVHNSVASYSSAWCHEEEIDAELNDWKKNGWLVECESFRQPTLPLMAVMQVSKDKIRPVLDYRELNETISSHTAGSLVCAEKLRNWRRMGRNLQIVDLRRAYLQIKVDQSLWQYQVVKHQGRSFYLTRLGFGLSIAPKIMRKILEHVLASDEAVKEGTDAYYDDIIVDTNKTTTNQLMSVLTRFGLEAKPPIAINGGRVLGLAVKETANGKLKWQRDGPLPQLPHQMTRRNLFAWTGQLLGHYPVGEWLRPSCSFIKRIASGRDWDTEVEP